MLKTKIICTISPSSETPDVLRQLIDNGMNVASLNFSHGSHAEHLEKIRAIRGLSQKTGQPVAILQDLSGSKIRIGTVKAPGLRLEPGSHFILTNQPVDGGGNRVSVSYDNLPQEVEEGDRILLTDGIMELVVKEIQQSEIHCRVVTGFFPQALPIVHKAFPLCFEPLATKHRHFVDAPD